MGRGGTFVQCLLLLYIIHSAFSLKIITGRTYYTGESHGEKKPYQYHADKKIFNFESVGFMPVRGSEDLNGRATKYAAGPRHRGDHINDYPFQLLNTTKCGIVIYQLCIITLVKCGDVQLNPGPFQQKMKKYVLKFPCLQCNLGINKRRVSCVNCENISHVKCISNLTIEKYEEFVNRNELIPFYCKFCVPNVDIDVESNIHMRLYYNKQTRTPSIGQNLQTPVVPADSTTTLIQPPPPAAAAAVVTTTTTTTTPTATTEAGVNQTRNLNNHATNVNTENNANVRRVIRPSLVTDSRFDCLKKKGLNFVHLNARSIFHKVSELKLITRRYRIAVLSITETWLDNSYTDQSIKIDGYNLLRRDRDTFAGGVCVYIREDLAFNARSDLQNDNLEDLWVEILLPRCKPIVIGTCYKAPDNNNLTESLENTLNLVNPESEIYVLGDFNICLLKDNSNFRKSYKNSTDLYNF